MADQKAGMELVDGRLGMPHIDSTDMSLIHTGLYGNGGNYVITGLDAGYADGSSVSITPGVGMIQGLFFTVTTTQTVSLSNGSTVYVHYHHDTANDVETVDLVSGSGLDAGTVQGGEDAYMPLYSVAGSSTTLLAKKMALVGGGGKKNSSRIQLGDAYVQVGPNGLDYTNPDYANAYGARGTQYLRMGNGGISLTTGDGTFINLTNHNGLSIDAGGNGRIVMDGSGINFQSASGGGLHITRSGMSLSWMSGTYAITGHTNGDVYIGTTKIGNARV